MKHDTLTDSAAKESLYLTARREWSERYGTYIKRAEQWRLIAFASMGVAAIAVASTAWLAGQSHVVPYVVEVNKLGEAYAVAPAELARSPDTRIIEAQLARWILNVRSVYADAGAERQLIEDAWAGMPKQSPASVKLGRYFRELSPFDRAQTETVSVQVESSLPITATTYRVDWSEERTARDGSVIDRTEWRADLTVEVITPRDTATILRNPEGIYVSDLNWSKRQ